MQKEKAIPPIVLFGKDVSDCKTPYQTIRNYEAGFSDFLVLHACRRLVIVVFLVCYW
jgi:hypothetical protein